VEPFKGWSAAGSTKTLPWYDAYNAVKHDRQNEFHRGTLLHTIEAVCGCAVMTFAQFGMSGFHYREEINSFFVLEKAPKWDWTEVYVVKGPSVVCRPVPYPF
jgi:hypothetical protein